VGMTVEAARRQIATALDLFVHLERTPDGRRRVAAISRCQPGPSGEPVLEACWVAADGGLLCVTGAPPPGRTPPDLAHPAATGDSPAGPGGPGWRETPVLPPRGAVDGWARSAPPRWPAECWVPPATGRWDSWRGRLAVSSEPATAPRWPDGAAPGASPPSSL